MDYRTKVLSKYFNLEAALPSGVAHAATRLAAAGSGTGIPTPQPPSPLNRLYKLGSLDREVHEANNSMLEQVFKDERINLRQKENIAKAVLKGDYDIGSPTARADGTRPGRLAAVHDLDLARGVGLLRRHRMKKPRFMELDGNQATIFIAKPSDLIAQEQAKRRSKEKKTSHFFLFNKYVQEENMPVRPGKTLRALEESKAASKFTQLKTDMLHESKLSTILRGKEEVTKLVKLVELEKRRYQEKVESKKDIRKKVEELRSKVHARLLEKKDPLAGKIIRAFDDKLAQAFMEQYRGYAMSADAIIATIGSRLGGAISSKEQAVMNVLEQAVGDYPSSIQSAPGNTHSPSRDPPHTLEQVLDKMPYTGDYPLLGRSFGSRGTYRPRPVTPPPVIAIEDNENNGIIESRGPREASGSELLSPIKRPTSVGGWKDRDHSDALGKGWNANTPTLKRKGAGFSVYSSGDQLTGKDIGLLSSRPQTTSGRVHSPATGGFPVVGDYALLSDSIASEMVDEDHETRHAITLLIDEMRGQGTLPSLQPERVFSDKQLDRLGTHETTVDIIARELQWQQKKKAQAASKLNNEAVSHSSTDPGKVGLHTGTITQSEVSSAGGGGVSGCDPAGNNIDVELGFQPRPISDGNFAAISAASIANRPTPSNEVVRITNATDIKIPRSLKTKKQTDPVEPYKSWDEKQNILNKGLAAGSGLALWTGSRIKEWGPRGKTPEGRYRVAAVGDVPDPDDEQGKAGNTSNKNAAAKNGRKKMQMLS